MQEKMLDIWDKPKYAFWVNQELQTEASIQKFFNSHLHFFWILQEARDIECKGVVFKPATAKNCDRKVVRFDINQQTAWWTPILEGAIKLKTEAFRICLTQSTLNSADSLWRPRRRTFVSAQQVNGKPSDDSEMILG